MVCMEKDVYIISKEYLRELLKSSSTGLVGKMMKRFELSSNLPEIKNQSRELVYETFRDFSNLLDAHQNGVEQSKWVFITPKKGKE